MYGCKTIDGYNFRSQFKEKFKISPTHDVIGQHRWTLLLNESICKKDHFSVESISRKQAGKTTTLRFWNAESRARGAGYLELPVYFLSLSRLFPIGESGKTKQIQVSLTLEEQRYCVRQYRKILSIQKSGSDPSFGVQKGTSSRVFTGVGDDVHDIFTNSAGESNITRIILAVLSFKRLKSQYPKDYKGGILLIDELDATLFSFSQTKLVEFLREAAEEFGIQIVFTTHSPIVLERVNKYQRHQKLGRCSPVSSHDCAIVHLEPKYDNEGRRFIAAENIVLGSDLSRTLSDINLSVLSYDRKIRVYCEDARAVEFVRFVLVSKLNINLDPYMSFVDVNLGWTNYIHLVERGVPEFTKNLIILDRDVLSMPEFSSNKNGGRSPKDLVDQKGNFLFLPLTIERDLFSLLKEHQAFSRFEKSFVRVPGYSYDICFSEWTDDAEDYKSNELKKWSNSIEKVVDGQSALFEFFCSEREDLVQSFVRDFVKTFNHLADDNLLDTLPEGANDNAI